MISDYVLQIDAMALEVAKSMFSIGLAILLVIPGVAVMLRLVKSVWP